MRSVTAVALLFLAFAGTALASGGGQIVGIVGTWHDGNKKTLHFGDSLQDDQDVICAGSGSLTLLLQTVDKPATLPCEGQDARTNVKEFADKNSHGATSEFFTHLYNLVSIQFSREPKSYIAAVSRGFGNPELEEAVLTLDGKRVDAGPALASAGAGNYSLAFFPLSEDVPEGTPVKLDWKPGTPAPVSPPGLHAGLAKMAIVSDDGTPASVAWVLIEPAEKASALKKSFAQARDMVAKWPGGAHAQVSRSVLRAYLQALEGGPTP